MRDENQIQKEIYDEMAKPVIDRARILSLISELRSSVFIFVADEMKKVLNGKEFGIGEVR